MRYLTERKQPALIACAICGKQGGTRTLCVGTKSYRVAYTFESAEQGAFTTSLAVCRAFTTAKRTKRMERRAEWLIYILIYLDLSPRQARRWYRRRFGIESSYRCAASARMDHFAQCGLPLRFDCLEFHFTECLAWLTLVVHADAPPWLSSAGYQTISTDAFRQVLAASVGTPFSCRQRNYCCRCSATMNFGSTESGGLSHAGSAAFVL
jgi:hypothetical protein